MTVKIIANPTMDILRIIDREMVFKKAKLARKIVASASKVAEKIEPPKPVVTGKGKPRAVRKATNRSSRKVITVAPTAPSSKTLRKRRNAITA